MDLRLRARGSDARSDAQPWAEIEAERGTELPVNYKALDDNRARTSSAVAARGVAGTTVATVSRVDCTATK
ncbi:hypothetical protein AB0L71_07975 [Streptomyces sp. NPDC052052]|uniref:hypothetical protein n=1 Tax=Streptomyces sp. NPDC052052 TaxID=3154756 RepID=UPI00343B6391